LNAFNGGEFGFEGSYICTIIIILAIAYAQRRRNNDKNASRYYVSCHFWTLRKSTEKEFQSEIEIQEKL